MKKVMISQPMNGKTDEEILLTKEKAVEFLEKEGYEVINTFFSDEFKTAEHGEEINVPVRFLAKSIESMVECSAVYFCKGWEDARGCRIEHAIAMEYGLKVFYEEEPNVQENCPLFVPLNNNE